MLTEDARLDKLDKVLRHEMALHRQIDTAVKMLNKEVPQLHAGRARRQALAGTQYFEAECKANLETELEVTVETRRLMQPLTAAPALDYALLDAAPTAQDQAEQVAAAKRQEECQNELPAWQWNQDEWEQRERARLLETLAHDVSEVHADGRPVSVTPQTWQEMQRHCENGDAEIAARYADMERERFLEEQHEARRILAAEARGEDCPPWSEKGFDEK